MTDDLSLRDGLAILFKAALIAQYGVERVGVAPRECYELADDHIDLMRLEDASVQLPE